MGELKPFVIRNWRAVVPPLVAGVLTAVYIYGTTNGGNSLMQHDVYRPQYSWHNFLTSNASFISELSYRHHVMSPAALLLLWTAVFIYAFMRRDHTLQLMAFWLLLVPLPIAFIHPIRGGGCLYLLLFGWATIFSKLVSDIIALILKRSTFMGQGVAVGATTGAVVGAVAAHWGRGAAIGAAIGACAGKLPPRMFRAFAITLLIFGIAIVTQWENQHLGRIPGIFRSGERTRHAIESFRSLDLHPASGSNILLRSIHPLFKNGWNSLFIASLVWNDHSLQIWLDGKNELSPQQVANMNYVISFTESEARLLRGPESPQQ